jgi:hypothetical protein
MTRKLVRRFVLVLVVVVVLVLESGAQSDGVRRSDRIAPT